MNPFLRMQLADSAFPAGGFTHSAGLEAAHQLGETRSAAGLRAAIDGVVLGAALTFGPFVMEAHAAADPGELLPIDDHLDAFLTGHVQRAASVAQGRALLSTMTQTMARVAANGPAITELDRVLREAKSPCHHAVVFGAAHAKLGASEAETAELFLHQALRGAVSAAIRLGAIGPHEAQRIQSRFAARCTTLSQRVVDLRARDASQPTPVLDVLANVQDRLYSRLFQS